MASDYRLERELSAGAFGTVHEASRKCALKSIDISSIPRKDKAAKKRDWKQEVETLMKVRGHENIVEYRNCFASVDDKLWIEMEYCNGGTLNDYVLKKKPGKYVTHRFLLEISSGVAFLHQNSIVHRDLKPENIMIWIDEDKQPHIKIVDFGLAKILADCNYGGQQLQYYVFTGCGTEYFMAPEVYDGHYTEKADIFSMGIIFYCISISKVKWITEGSKKYIVKYNPAGNLGASVATPFGKYMHDTGKGLFYVKVLAGEMSDKVLKLFDSMIDKNYKKRPSAQVVNTALQSISPKELSMLAP